MWGSEPTDLNLYVNGAIITTGVQTSSSPEAFVPNPRAAYVGYRNIVVPVEEEYTGDIAEIVVYDRKLSNSERNQVEAYLGDKYGIELAVAIEGGPSEGIPAAFAFSSAYPNPFNLITTFNLAVPEAGRVAIEAFDMLGRRVAVLHEGDLAAGTYTLRFEPGELPSGTYLVRAVEAGGVQTRTVTLLR